MYMPLYWHRFIKAAQNAIVVPTDAALHLKGIIVSHNFDFHILAFNPLVS